RLLNMLMTMDYTPRRIDAFWMGRQAATRERTNDGDHRLAGGRASAREAARPRRRGAVRRGAAGDLPARGHPRTERGGSRPHAAVPLRQPDPHVWRRRERVRGGAGHGAGEVCPTA